MNKAFFTGNLTRNPETKVMTNGKPRTTFTVAVTRSYTNAQGERDADFIQIICYEKRAELAEKYLAKGRKVLVEAHIRTGSYEKDDRGEKRRVYTTEFVADKIEFLSSAKDTAVEQESTTTDGETGHTDTGSGYGGFTPVDDEDLPF